ncbi:uncharacterized protein ARB_07124 [Trichophyton benhamiae CBS 112371]|uniref:Uncharacterized protein n=1 Tax=Arthroderma benhamiae (strain ATCC MYA-4681 / CBS 112371) TaxID=663331 RepID=D4ASA9_ARTBC|nr:uncharacterized protein ARB_07124 [Trichophyton benhamiae CBS 112371]EFE34173.1 hypothetical protein ARB_07124 [Trichophyton benhamiae CBS 112371]
MKPPFLHSYLLLLLLLLPSLLLLDHFSFRQDSYSTSSLSFGYQFASSTSLRQIGNFKVLEFRLKEISTLFLPALLPPSINSNSLTQRLQLLEADFNLPLFYFKLTSESRLAIPFEQNPRKPKKT